MVDCLMLCNDWSIIVMSLPVFLLFNIQLYALCVVLDYMRKFRTINIQHIFKKLIKCRDAAAKMSRYIQEE